jgi:hypothetical protein
VWGYARGRRPNDAPLVFNPQGLEEFGGVDGSYGGRTLKGYGYAPLQAVVRDCARHSDAVIATDNSIVPVVRRHLPALDDRLRLIPNGIDVTALDALADGGAAAAMRARSGAAADDVLLLSVGRLEANKGISRRRCRPSTAARDGAGSSSATVRTVTRCCRRCVRSASASECSCRAASTTSPCTRGMAPRISSFTRRGTKAARS